MLLYLLARTNIGTHPSSADQGLLKRFKPESITASMLVIIITKSLQSRNDKVMCRGLRPVDYEDQDFEDNPSGLQIRRVK